MFQRFFGLQAGDLLINSTYPSLPKPRTDEVLMIEVLVSSGTEAKQKHALLGALIAQLGTIGVDENDVMVFFGEVDRAISSIGNRKIAPPVVIGQRAALAKRTLKDRREDRLARAHIEREKLLKSCVAVRATNDLNTRPSFQNHGGV